MREQLTRRALLVGSVAAAFPLALHSAAATRRDPYRVGFLIGNGFPSMVRAFREELRRLGYAEGKDLLLDLRESPPETTRKNAIELAAAGHDVIVAAALPQALTFRSINPNLKMVVATAPGMVSNGLAASLERPGGNVTGMDELPPGVTAKRLRFLKTAVPQITRVALLSTTPGRGGHEQQLADAEAVAPELGVTLKVYRPSTGPELMAALPALVTDGMQGFLNFQGGLSLGFRNQIVAFARLHRLPAIYQSRLFVEAGGLMSYAPDQEEQYRQAARYVDRILKGAKPGDLPIHHPERYYLTVNRAEAAAIGVKLPVDFLRQANQIVG